LVLVHGFRGCESYSIIVHELVPDDDVFAPAGRLPMTVRAISAAVLTLFFGVLAAAQQLTLDEAVRLAMETHPSLRAADSGIEVAADRVRQAKAGRLPQLQFTETFARSNNPVFAFGSLLEQNRFAAENLTLSSLNDPASVNNFRALLSSRFPLFDGRQTSSRVAQAEAHGEVAAGQRLALEQRLRYEVVRSYHEIALAEALRAAAARAVSAAEADATLARSRRDAGVAVDGDVLAAEVQVADSRRRQIQTEGDVAIAIAELNSLIGRPFDSPLVITPTLTRTFTVALPEELQRTAVSERPDLKASRALVSAAAAATREQRAESLPRVEVFANTGLSSRSVLPGSTDYTVGASVAFSIFDAGRNARAAERRHAEAMVEAEHREKERQIRLEVLRARQAVVTASEQIRAAAVSAAQAREALRITEDRYREGLATITAVLRAQADVSRAETNEIAAQHAYITGYAALLLSTGALTDVRPFTVDAAQGR
jgi:outer membrane protein TolC